MARGVISWRAKVGPIRPRPEPGSALELRLADLAARFPRDGADEGDVELDAEELNAAERVVSVQIERPSDFS